MPGAAAHTFLTRGEWLDDWDKNSWGFFSKKRGGIQLTCHPCPSGIVWHSVANLQAVIYQWEEKLKCFSFTYMESPVAHLKNLSMLAEKNHAI